jgi:alkylhydroperoxidase family enzyme
MSRIPSPAAESLDDDARQIYDRMPMNVTLMMLGASPEVARAFIAFGKSFYSGSALPPRLREIAALRVAYLLGADYTLLQHVPIAEQAGVTAADVEAIREGGARAAELGPEGAAVVAFTDDVVQTSRAGDEALAAVREFLDDRLVMDLTMAIGCFWTASSYMRTTGVDLDAAPLDPQFHTPAR